MTLKPKVGMRFVHADQLHPTLGRPSSEWPHETCTVVDVTDERVYFQNTTGFFTTVTLDRFPGIVQEVVDG